MASYKFPPQFSRVEASEMYERYRHGDTLQAIADDYGISREGVRQVFIAHGLKLLSIKERRPPKPPPPKPEPLRGLERTRFYAGNRQSVRAYSDEDMLAILKEIAAKSGRDTVTIVEYHRAYEADPTLPSKALYTSRFDTWNTALKLAGLQPGRSFHRTYTRVTAEECVEAVVRAAEIVGWLPSVTEYETLRLNRPELKLPSLSLVRVRLGTWSKAIEAAAALQGANGG